MKANSERGQMRIVEVILASFIIVFAITFANIFAITPTSPKYEATEMEKLGYNALLDLDKQGLLASFVYKEEWENLESALRVLLPSDVYFNMSVYDLNWNIVNPPKAIFYGDEKDFEKSKNIASITYGLSGYSTEDEIIYEPRTLVLQLARG